MTIRPISVNSAVSDTLGGLGDYYDQGSGRYYDFFLLTNLAPGRTVTVDLASGNFDTYLDIYNANTGEIIGSDDDSGAGTNSLFSFTPVFGDQNGYYAIVSSYAPNSAGNYTLSVV